MKSPVEFGAGFVVGAVLAVDAAAGGDEVGDPERLGVLLDAVASDPDVRISEIEMPSVRCSIQALSSE